MSSGLYVPGTDGRFKFQEAAEKEERPLLLYEQDTGRLFFNFNAHFTAVRRKAQDVITQTTPSGRLGGIIVTSVPMGPDEIEALEKRLKGG